MADAVNPPVVETLIPNVDIHAVMTAFGFMDVSTCTWIIINESFQSLPDFGVLDDDKDMLEMVKHLGSHTEAAGHVYVGTIQVNKLQALFYWVHDH